MRPDERIPVTVVMRSYNDAPLLPRTLAGLDAQVGVELTLFVFESASTDGSKEIFEQHGYDRIVHLEPGAYHSASVLNQGTEWAASELVAYVNSDAVMLHERVLRQLADAILADGHCAGAFAKQVVRSDATLMTRLDYEAAFEHRQELGEFADHMSLVTSMVRRSVWQEQPFDVSLTFAEDYVWSARVKEKGYRLAYVPQAVVEHSHNYTSDELYRRSFGDSAALAVIAQQPPADAWLKGFALPYAKRCVRDVWRLARMRELGAAWQVPVYRLPAYLGSWKGAREGWRHFQHAKHATQPQPTVRRGLRWQDAIRGRK